MLRVLRDWFRRRAAASRRAIFPFWDGRRTRSIDPMVAYRALATHPQFIWRDHPRYLERDHEALRITLAAVRETFALQPLDRGGLTDAETLELFLAFCEFLDVAKKNTSSWLILPPPTERASSVPISSTITKSASDSSSTAPEPTSAVVEASPPESSPPTDSPLSNTSSPAPTTPLKASISTSDSSSSATSTPESPTSTPKPATDSEV